MAEHPRLTWRRRDSLAIAIIIVLAAFALAWIEWGRSIAPEQGGDPALAEACSQFLGPDFTGPASAAVDAAQNGSRPKLDSAIKALSTVRADLQVAEIRELADEVYGALREMRAHPAETTTHAAAAERGVSKVIAYCDPYL